MTTRSSNLHVHNIDVEVVRKDIKNIHLAVYPPLGRVRVAAPQTVSDATIKKFVVKKSRWIRHQQSRFLAQVRQAEPDVVTGESFLLFGKRYRLQIVQGRSLQSEVILRSRRIEILVAKSATDRRRLALLNSWTRDVLGKELNSLIVAWQDRIGVRVNSWSVRRMKTKWGSSNVNSCRILFNATLAQKPIECIEYVVVHELAHLREPGHGDSFIALLDEHLPDWRRRRARLSRGSLPEERWTI